MKTLHIALPDFATMSDDEVEDHHLTRAKDGRWSTQTRQLLANFETDKLDLNEAWAQTSTGWKCRSCNRQKAEIARKTDSNVLLCQLDWHHDHLSDAADKIICDRIGRGIDDDSRHARLRACAAAKPLIERFAPVLLCNDCNAADAAMKARLGTEVPRAFSFSHLEITRFVKPEPNQKHEIDVEAGRRLWPAALADFCHRMAFVEQMAERIAAGLHDRPVASLDDLTDAYRDPRIVYALATAAGGTNNQPSGIGMDLLARSRSAAGRSITGSKRKAAPVLVPSLEDFRSVDQVRSHESFLWRNSGDDWRCPTCQRSKFETLRRSNKGAWGTNIMSLNDYRRETDAESLSRRRTDGISFVLSHHTEIGVCRDCRQIVTDAISAQPGSDQDSIRLSDIAALAGRGRPHASHEVDREAVMTVIEANSEWQQAVKNYRLHEQEVRSVGSKVEIAMHNHRTTEYAARYIVVPNLLAAGGLPAEDPYDHFDWLMSQYRLIRR